MFSLFSGGIQKEINRGFFLQLTRRDQDAFLQYLYNQGYSVPEISKEVNLPAPTIYNRIDAHRGRGPQPA
ncbi:putative ATPase subunit of terminase (gpP-like) [compost metagenome]